MSEITTHQLKEDILAWFNQQAEESQSTSYPYSGEVRYTTRVWSEFYGAIDSHYSSPQIQLASGTAEMVEDVGGGEGDGEERYVVFSVGGQYFQVSGYYASWDGTTWEDIDPVEVFPKEVTVVRYVERP